MKREELKFHPDEKMNQSILNTIISGNWELEKRLTKEEYHETCDKLTDPFALIDMYDKVCVFKKEKENGSIRNTSNDISALSDSNDIIPTE